MTSEARKITNRPNGLRITLRVEELEGRYTPAISLSLVALHEFGHSLGLNHTSDSSSIMYAYLNPNYNVNNFASDSAVATFRSLYANPDSSPWKDNLDGFDNGVADISYSFMPDGVRLDQGKTNSLNATMNAIFGVGGWQDIFKGELDRWAGVSNNTVAFHPHDGDGLENGAFNFNVSGLAQNDSRFGDIRIGTHRFDGPGKTLAHTYFPPPNGATAAGDAHFDQAENWALSSGGLTGPGGGGGGGGHLTLGSVQSLFGVPTSLSSPRAASDLIVDDFASGADREQLEPSTVTVADQATARGSEVSELSGGRVDDDTQDEWMGIEV